PDRFAAAAVPASWFALLLGVPLSAASWGWSPFATGLLLVPSAVIGFVSPRIARTLLARIGPRRSIALACPTAVIALLTAATGAFLESPTLLALAVVLVSGAFGIGQPAMISSVGSAVREAQRGVALGIATLVVLTGASVGAALVGGLASLIGVPTALCLLVLLPLAGLTALLRGAADRVEAGRLPAGRHRPRAARAPRCRARLGRRRAAVGGPARRATGGRPRRAAAPRRAPRWPPARRPPPP